MDPNIDTNFQRNIWKSFAVIAYSIILEERKWGKVWSKNLQKIAEKLSWTFMKVLRKYDKELPSCFQVRNIGRNALKLKRKNGCHNKNFSHFFMKVHSLPYIITRHAVQNPTKGLAYGIAKSDNFYQNLQKITEKLCWTFMKVLRKYDKKLHSCFHVRNKYRLICIKA